MKGRGENIPLVTDTGSGLYKKAFFKAQSCTRIIIIIMAKRSEAMVLRKTGGRQNVLLLRTLKRTRLASASTCLDLGWISFYKKKQHHINFHGPSNTAPGR